MSAYELEIRQTLLADNASEVTFADFFELMMDSNCAGNVDENSFVSSNVGSGSLQ